MSPTPSPPNDREAKVALITGITGQDGSYLAELLLKEGYAIHGTTRRTSLFNRSRIDQTREKALEKGLIFDLHYADLTDYRSLEKLIVELKPDEVYNLASQSHIGISFDQPELTAQVSGLGTLRLLESVRAHHPQARFYEACSSEMFGGTTISPQCEETPFYPLSPYAIAKQFSFSTIRNYREAYQIHASSGILYNHESPRRGENFVTRKIVMQLTALQQGKTQKPLNLGNLEACRDWGYAKDYVQAMWLMLQQEKPGDYVIATGQSHSVREFVEAAFKALETEVIWEGDGVDEVGRHSASGEIWVRIDPEYFRPLDHRILVGDATKARKRLGWKPSVTFEELVDLMVRAELES